MVSPPTQRILAIHDLSCVGRCSLTVIIPLLSAMGFQVCPLPTAVLSTHFGGFSKVSACDLTEHLNAFSAHWQREGVSFDCIYTGFLASEQQIDIVSQIIDDFSGPQSLVLVDPVMGDEGKLYSVYTPQMQQQMKTLVQKADIITPNYTEACFLLDKPFSPASVDLSEVAAWLPKLAAMGPQKVIITGIPLENNQVANLGYDHKTQEYHQHCHEMVPVKFPGTGDAFASILLGKLLSHSSLARAMEQAGNFVSESVKYTVDVGTPAREGILLESLLARGGLNQ